MSTEIPPTYTEPEYEAAPQATYERQPRFPITPVLPPGITHQVWTKATQAFISVLGPDAVLIDSALSDYINPYDLHEAESAEDESAENSNSNSKRKVPSAAVCPSSTDQLSAILKIANEFTIPLWTFSRGKNLVWPSTASLGWGSVMGNTLDRGTGFGALFTHHQFIAGLEVMLASGEDLVRTGQWGITANDSPNAFLSKFTYGPSIEGLFLQSNLGVVTKMSIWLQPQPQAFMSCSFSMPLFDDLEVMVDAFSEMRRDGTIPSCVWFASLIEMLCIAGRREDYWKGEGPIPDWRLEGLRLETGYGHWYARFRLYRPKRVVEAQFEEIKEVLAKKAPTGTISGSLYTDEEGVNAGRVPVEHGSMFVGVPQLWSLPLIKWPIPKSKTDRKAAHGDYAPVIPSSGKLVMEWLKKSKPIYQADPVQRQNIKKLYYGLHKVAKERGYGMYRAHVNHMGESIVACLNDFNGHVYNRFDTLDPRGVLSPGKQGIWPSGFRHLRENQEYDG
ncbi:hypothetical protein QBC32DRAFT_371965 [Pseudoneurospora amorphoporcata]|uniref:FAD-binding PCMH-type domain-containing protein n=1 Tax=Pseudoneurospora amorphoporcata TaxID=241081 RepID=A0AAN6NRD6_9PEZI|nr:hypothetical protein QBC32DRAFT_371965 [Pseudoneurospora amorphoporcata]